MPKLLLAAGGTGGHMFPAQALAEILATDGWEIAMFTDARGLKHSHAIPANPIKRVEAATLSPRRPIAAAFGVFKLLRGTAQAKTFMKTWQPDVVVGFGGYPAFPVMRAATRLGVPIILHEQNAVLGRVNRIFAKQAQYVASGFDELAKLPAGVLHKATGNPLRQMIRCAVPLSYNAPQSDGKINLLIVGGSLGARTISENLPKAIAALPSDLRFRLNVVQQTREESLGFANQIYEHAGVNATCAPFFRDIDTYLARAHYVVGRAGASSVSEVALMGKPSLFIPLKIAMDDHQTANAEALSRMGAADIVLEDDLSVEALSALLETRLVDVNWLENAAQAARTVAKPDAAEALAELVGSAVTSNPGSRT